MFDKLYMKFPWLYKRHSWIRTLPKKARILDLGCGQGKFLYRLSLTGKDLTLLGLDKRCYLMEKMSDRVIFVSHDLNQLPLPYEDDFFDSIISTHVIEHLEDPGRLFSDLNRILKPGGVLYIETPNNRSLFADFPCLDFLDRRHEVDFLNYFDELEHKRPHTRLSLIKLAKSAGFSDSKTFIARNRLAILAFPFALFYAILLGKGKVLGYSLGHIIGTSTGCLIRK